MKRGVRISRVFAESKAGKIVLMVAGEASADQHGANLVRTILRQDPGVFFLGIGGDEMARAGVRILFSSSEMAVVGLTEVFSRIPVIYKAARRLKHILKENRPDLLILLDYPDFNIHLARTAKRCGVPVLYYISPQVWAWRKGRVRKIRNRVDRMAVILPFEETFYRNEGISVDYVGHPLLDSAPAPFARGRDGSNGGMPNQGPVLGLLPGSRNEEVSFLLPAMVSSAELLKNKHPKLRCVLPLTSTVDAKLVREITGRSKINIALSGRNIYEVLKACDVVIAASGTVTLEVAMMGIPMVVAYRVSWLSYHIGRMIIRVPHISLVNLVAGKRVVPELIQGDATPEKMAREAETLLSDRGARYRMIKDLGMIRERLGSKGASRRTAEIALEMMR
ncbi:MAG: lipid-A-disaccharide synthase [Desulfatiglandaceae bacterium]